MDLKNLKKLREKKGITQVRLSVDLEISQEIISQYELSKTLPTCVNLDKIATYFNTSTDYLLNRTNNPLPIQNLNKKDIEITDITEKYNSLSTEDKKQFMNFLDFLCNK